MTTKYLDVFPSGTSAHFDGKYRFMKIVKVSDGPQGGPKGGTSPDPTSA